MNDSTEAIRKVFEIEDVDQEELAGRILSNLNNHHLETPEEWLSYAIMNPGKGTNPIQLEASLLQASKYYDKIHVQLSLTPSRSPLLTRLRSIFHQLVLYYVNRLGDQQIVFNDRILRVVHQFSAILSEKDVEIAELKKEIMVLTKRLDDLEGLKT